MAENKTKPGIETPAEIFDALPDEKMRADSYEILEMMKEITGIEPVVWASTMIGFGSYDYKYASGHSGTAFEMGFAPRKGKLSLYLTSKFEENKHIMEKLGKHKTGKCCIYIKSLDQVNREALKDLIKITWNEKDRTC
ncbi:MAG: DUF1801 domain-containing protein [Ignavibacteriaceae bacterium]|nr:DUF1801 domain-containing protein [Ignavibacteriaceae bacterium]